mgnify:CR=1 FL=1
MGIPKKYLFPILYGVSALFFVVGFTIWLFAYLYKPLDPVVKPVGKINIPPVPSSYSLNRYQSLMSGRLFFGGVDPATEIPIVTFRSRLLLWGVIQNGHAVVGLDPNNHGNDRVVTVGDTVEGETITAIGDGYIMVKNQTGQGRVKMYGD